MTHCGIIAIIGAPNAGKSTLVNRVVGSKIAIVTPKAQTTRQTVRGVAMLGESQMIFIDTPGIFKAEAKFERGMVEAAWSAVADADTALMLLDAEIGVSALAREVMTELKLRKGDTKKPLFLALNKIDQVEKGKLLTLIGDIAALDVFDEIFMISATTGDGVKPMLEALINNLPTAPWLYPEDELTDASERLLASEITREQLFLTLNQELPYSLMVETEAWEDKGKLAVVSQAIIVERESHKKIVLGEKGARIKTIGMKARLEMERVLGRKIHLTLFVKVRKDWKEKNLV